MRNTDGLRDLELANETRKTLERMLYQTLAEPASKTLSSAQQGFIPGREITRNKIMLADAFWRAAAKAAKDPTYAKPHVLVAGLQERVQFHGVAVA